MYGLTLSLPNKKTKGFLGRQKRIIRLTKAMMDVNQENISEDSVDSVENFILEFVVSPSPEEAREILEELSEEEFSELFSSIANGNGGEDPNFTKKLDSSEKP